MLLCTLTSARVAKNLIELIGNLSRAKIRIARSVVEIGARHIGVARRHVRQFIALDTAFERELELDAARIIDKQLPQRRSRYDELAKWKPSVLEPGDEVTIA